MPYRMHQAKYIRPYSRQGCHRIACEAIPSSRPPSGRSQFSPVASCAFTCWLSGLLCSPEVVRAVELASDTPGGSSGEVKFPSKDSKQTNSAMIQFFFNRSNIRVISLIWYEDKTATGVPSLIWNVGKTVQEWK